MSHDYILFVPAKQETKYLLKWLENRNGELVERSNLFGYPEDRMRYIKDMLETGRLFDLVEVNTYAA